MNALLFDFINVTEKAALAAYPWIGRGEKNDADGASTQAMRDRLNLINMEGKIVIGEGELDEAPMLYIGERVGSGRGPAIDIAVDPLDGTTLISKGQGNSIAVIAGAPRGCLLHAPDIYMQKIAVGPKSAGKIDLDASLFQNLKAVAEANEKKISELNIIIQDRERHEELIREIRSLGASVTLFHDGDVIASIATAINKLEFDMFIGTGGAPEGVVSAVALACLGGDFQGRLLPANEQEYARCIKMGISNPTAKLTLNDIVKSPDCFFVATGVTDGLLLKGVSSNGGRMLTSHSFVTSGAAGGYQFVKTIHELV
ncbi:class II fructose-bisphosphatase [Cytobacillus oceanisediminis]|uniref:class II fructose-bisphosphatase n=1 Tax=Cytobacillus oceanisediminis TaxID=665099 RepID=UPI003736E86A